MALRRRVGLGVALAIGIALGYGVRSKAQGELLIFRVEPAPDGHVRVNVSHGGVDYVEDQAIQVSVLPDAALVVGSRNMTMKMRSGPGGITALVERSDAIGNVTKSFRIPTK